MIQRILRSSQLVAVACLLAFAVPVAADTLLTLERTQQGENENPSEIEIWIGKDRVSRADGRTTIVLEKAANELLVVNHQAKSFSRIALPIDVLAMLPEEMKSMAAMFDLEVAVSPSEETQAVGEWKGRRYDLEITNPMGMAVTSKLWMADLDLDLEPFRDLTMSIATMQPGGKAVVEKLEKVPGFPVLNETTYDLGGNVFTFAEQLISIREGEAPANAYGAPADYDKIEWDPLTALGGGP
ncbi:MAG: DUF4412 domain-containing protein [Acidobacteriota bacterium]